MRRFRRECGLKKARILRERLILVSQGLKIGINRQPLISGSSSTRRILCLCIFRQSFLFPSEEAQKSGNRSNRCPHSIHPDGAAVLKSQPGNRFSLRF